MSLIKAHCPDCGYNYKISLTKKELDKLLAEYKKERREKKNELEPCDT